MRCYHKAPQTELMHRLAPKTNLEPYPNCKLNNNYQSPCSIEYAIDQYTLLFKGLFSMIRKEILLRLTNSDKVIDGNKYVLFYHGHVTVMINYIANYLS